MTCALSGVAEPIALSDDPLPKTCTRCGYEGTTVDFNRNHENRDGYNTICKECKRKANAERRVRLLAAGVDDAELSTPKTKEQMGAKWAVHGAVRAGRLVRKCCEHPGCNQPNTEAHHHKGYAREYWLDVVWLCRSHHRYAHELDGTAPRQCGYGRFEPRLRAAGMPVQRSARRA